MFLGHNTMESRMQFRCPLVLHKERVMPMSIIEVLTLLLLVFNVLSYLDNHFNKKK